MANAVSLIYSHELLYRALIKALFGRHFQERYRVLAAEIPEGSSVVDVCAGDCYLYRKYLHAKSVDYLGLDLSSQFVKAVCQHGVNARVFNVWQERIPPADIVVMQGSLYQFLPNAGDVIQRMLTAARRKAIVSEPVNNLSTSRMAWVARLSRRLTRPADDSTQYSGLRFDKKSLSELFNSFPSFRYSFLIPGEREMVGVFSGEGAC